VSPVPQPEPLANQSAQVAPKEGAAVPLAEAQILEFHKFMNYQLTKDQRIKLRLLFFNEKAKTPDAFFTYAEVVALSKMKLDDVLQKLSRQVNGHIASRNEQILEEAKKKVGEDNPAMYPLFDPSVFGTVAAEQGLSLSLLLGIALQETRRFDPFAVSPTNDYGLMQINIKTAKNFWAAFQDAGLIPEATAYSEEEAKKFLFNAENNLRAAGIILNAYQQEILDLMETLFRGRKIAMEAGWISTHRTDIDRLTMLGYNRGTGYIKKAMKNAAADGADFFSYEVITGTGEGMKPEDSYFAKVVGNAGVKQSYWETGLKYGGFGGAWGFGMTFMEIREFQTSDKRSELRGAGFYNLLAVLQGEGSPKTSVLRTGFVKQEQAGVAVFGVNAGWVAVAIPIAIISYLLATAAWDKIWIYFAKRDLMRVRKLQREGKLKPGELAAYVYSGRMPVDDGTLGMTPAGAPFWRVLLQPKWETPEAFWAHHEPFWHRVNSALDQYKDKYWHKPERTGRSEVRRESAEFKKNLDRLVDLSGEAVLEFSNSDNQQQASVARSEQRGDAKIEKTVADGWEQAVESPETVFSSDYIHAVRGALRLITVTDNHADIEALIEHFKKIGLVDEAASADEILQDPKRYLRIRKGDVIVFDGDFVNSHFPVSFPRSSREALHRATPNLDLLRFVRDLKKVAGEKGAQVVLVLGNHDHLVQIVFKILEENLAQGINRTVSEAVALAGEISAKMAFNPIFHRSVRETVRELFGPYPSYRALSKRKNRFEIFFWVAKDLFLNGKIRGHFWRLIGELVSGRIRGADLSWVPRFFSQELRKLAIVDNNIFSHDDILAMTAARVAGKSITFKKIKSFEDLDREYERLFAEFQESLRAMLESRALRIKLPMWDYASAWLKNPELYAAHKKERELLYQMVRERLRLPDQQTMRLILGHDTSYAEFYRRGDVIVVGSLSYYYREIARGMPGLLVLTAEGGMKIVEFRDGTWTERDARLTDEENPEAVLSSPNADKYRAFLAAKVRSETRSGKKGEYNEAAAVDIFIRLFKEKSGRVPDHDAIARELAIPVSTLNYHMQDLLLAVETRASRDKALEPDLRKDLQTAIQKHRETFGVSAIEAKATSWILQQFSEETRVALPSMVQVAGAIEVNRLTVRHSWSRILYNLRNFANDPATSDNLRARIRIALEFERDASRGLADYWMLRARDSALQKQPLNILADLAAQFPIQEKEAGFALEQSMGNVILNLFEQEPERLYLPSLRQLGEYLKVNPELLRASYLAFLQNGDRTFFRAGNSLRARLQKAIAWNDSIPLKGGEQIVLEFQRDTRRTKLPELLSLAQAAGVTPDGVKRYLPNILTDVARRITGPEFSATLRDRIWDAVLAEYDGDVLRDWQVIKPVPEARMRRIEAAVASLREAHPDEALSYETVAAEIVAGQEEKKKTDPSVTEDLNLNKASLAKWVELYWLDPRMRRVIEIMKKDKALERLQEAVAMMEKIPGKRMAERDLREAMGVLGSTWSLWKKRLLSRHGIILEDYLASQGFELYTSEASRREAADAREKQRQEALSLREAKKRAVIEARETRRQEAANLREAKRQEAANLQALKQAAKDWRIQGRSKLSPAELEAAVAARRAEYEAGKSAAAIAAEEQSAVPSGKAVPKITKRAASRKYQEPRVEVPAAAEDVVEPAEEPDNFGEDDEDALLAALDGTEDVDNVAPLATIHETVDGDAAEAAAILSKAIDDDSALDEEPDDEEETPAIAVPKKPRVLIPIEEWTPPQKPESAKPLRVKIVFAQAAPEIDRKAGEEIAAAWRPEPSRPGVRAMLFDVLELEQHKFPGIVDEVYEIWYRMPSQEKVQKLISGFLPVEDQMEIQIRGKASKKRVLLDEESSDNARSEARLLTEKTPGMYRGTAYSTPGVERIYAGILGSVLKQEPAPPNIVQQFTNMANSKLDQTVAALRETFENIFLPNATAEMASRGESLAAGYQKLERVLQVENISRATFQRLAEAFYDRSLKDLDESIRKSEVGGMAPVVFYSPEIRDNLIRFIETVQKGFEATGDVTGVNYRVTLIFRDRSQLQAMKTELSKRGALRGVYFAEDGRSLDRDIFENVQFKDRFGVFFPDEASAGQIPAWQRVVRTEIPKEYAIVLLPALSRYFASVTTSEINATTLRRALPDLFASAAFRVGQGIAIVAELLEHITAAERDLSTSA